MSNAKPVPQVQESDADRYRIPFKRQVKGEIDEPSSENFCSRNGFHVGACFALRMCIYRRLEICKNSGADRVFEQLRAVEADRR
jgi:hypothetical protein